MGFIGVFAPTSCRRGRRPRLPDKLGFIALRAKCKMQNVKCKIKGYRCVRTIQRRGAHCASVKRILPKNGRPVVAPTVFVHRRKIGVCRCDALSVALRQAAGDTSPKGRGLIRLPRWGSCRGTRLRGPDKSKFEAFVADSPKVLSLRDSRLSTIFASPSTHRYPSIFKRTIYAKRLAITTASFFFFVKVFEGSARGTFSKKVPLVYPYLITTFLNAFLPRRTMTPSAKSATG